MILTSFALRSATVFPSFAEFTSMSSKRPRRSDSDPVPWAEPSTYRNTLESLSLRFSSERATARTLQNSSEGRMKKPFVLTISSRANSASVSSRRA